MSVDERVNMKQKSKFMDLYGTKIQFKGQYKILKFRDQYEMGCKIRNHGVINLIFIGCSNQGIKDNETFCIFFYCSYWRRGSDH